MVLREGATETDTFGVKKQKLDKRRAWKSTLGRGNREAQVI